MDSDLENEEPIRVENGKRRSQNDTLLDLNRITKKPRTRTLSNNNTLDNLEDFTFAEYDDDDDILLAPRVTKYRRVLRHIPVDIPYIPVTTESGSRVYLRILQKKKKSSTTTTTGPFNADDADYSDDDLDENESRKLISTVGGSNRKLFSDWDKIKSDARLLKTNFQRSLGTIVRNENVVEGIGGVLRQQKNNGPCEESLWVEKYKPRAYMDLLSEEATNKTLLHWLKLWDKSVFGSDFLSKVKLTKEKYAKLDAKEKEKEHRFHSKYNNPNAQQPIAEEGYDESGRPKFKVALLYGPPGLGKTTAAHIVAKHAGYSVREMNASDDRSVETFRKVLDDALQSRSEIFHDGKPNCLVIDEIDGAPLPTVSVLVELISGHSTEKGKGKKIKKVLKRPIICICNDLYAPSLKELRRHALVLQFNPVTVASLGEKLTEISFKEQLHLDNATIAGLCDKSECDIRSCLSTLQFLKTKKCTQKDALFSLVGMKDKTKGLFPVWQDIFTIPDGKKKHSQDEDNSKPSIRFKNMHKVVQSFGEYEKLLGGVFENYLRIKFKDCYFESILDGLEWTNWFHEMNSTISYSQNYVLMGYLPIYFVACHFLFGQRSWFKVNYPSNDKIQKIPRVRNTISTLLSEVKPSVGKFLDPHDAVTDLFPSLISVIQPGTIRPVPTQIWTAGERQTLRNVVEIMITYNLSYTQMKGAETGAYNFILEPDIGALVKFNIQENNGSKRNFPYAVKQLVAREIDTEKMRRSDNSSSLSEENQPSTSTTTITPAQTSSSELNKTKTPEKSQSQSQGSDFKMPKPISKSGSPQITTDPTMTKDFFGRQVKLSVQNSQDLLAQKRRASGIHFRFKEGYSNAVRRFVKMKDLE